MTVQEHTWYHLPTEELVAYQLGGLREPLEHTGPILKACP